MADQEVGRILQGLIAGQQRRNEQARLQQQQQSEQSLAEYRKNEIDLRQKQLDQQNAQFAAAQKAAQAMRDLNVLKTKASMATMPLEQVQSIPEMGTAEANPNDVNSVILHHPILGTIVHPTTQREIEVEQQRQQAKAEPLIQGRLKEIQLQKEYDETRAEAQKKADFERMQMQKASDDSRAVKVAEISAAARRYAADHKQGEAIDPDIASSYADRLGHGEMSLEEFNKQPVSKATKQAALHSLTQSGLVAPTQKQLDTVTTLGPVARMFPVIEEYNQLLANHPIAARIPGNDSYQRANALKAELEQIMPNVARTIASDTGRLSNQQIQMARAAAEPSANFLTSDPKSNIQKAKDFLSVVHAAADARLGNLPASQREAIKARIGLPPKQGVSSGSPRILKFDSQGNQVQ